VVRVARADRVFRRRWTSTAATRRDPRSRANSPRLRAAESCSVRVIVFTFPIPSVGTARKEEGENPDAFNHIGTRPPGRWDNARRSRSTGPAVKTSNPRLPPRDAEHAVGGIRAWDENPGRRASSPTTVLRSRALARADPKSPTLIVETVAFFPAWGRGVSPT
jgi:hypothetical protein